MVLVGDFNVAMTPKDVHPSIPFEGLYGAQEMAIMQVGGAGAKGLQAHMEHTHRTRISHQETPLRLRFSSLGVRAGQISVHGTRGICALPPPV